MKLKKNIQLAIIVFLSTFLFLLGSSTAFSSITKFYPASLLKLDDKLSNTILILEASTKKFHLYKNNGGIPEFLKSFQVIKTKNSIKAPFVIDDAIYFFNNAEGDKQINISRSTINSEKQGKLSDIVIRPYQLELEGIDEGLNKNTQYIYISDESFTELLRTSENNKLSVITTEALSFIKEKTWLKNKLDLNNFLNKWIKAWASENLVKYISFYDKVLYSDDKNRNYYKLKNYKKYVFQRNESPQIEISNISIINFGKLIKVDFYQDYSSSAISDFGHKTLYLKKDSYYSWKIIYENWKKTENTQNGMPQ